MGDLCVWGGLVDWDVLGGWGGGGVGVVGVV